MDNIDFQGVRKIEDKVEFCVHSPDAVKVELGFKGNTCAYTGIT